MSVTAQLTDDWYLQESDPQSLYEGIPGAGGGSFEKREHWVITISRKLFGVTQHISENGNIQISFTLRTGPTTQVVLFSTNKKYNCTCDRLTEVDATTGEMLQTQVWEYMSVGTAVPVTQFDD